MITFMYYIYYTLRTKKNIMIYCIFYAYMLYALCFYKRTFVRYYILIIHKTSLKCLTT